MHIGCVFNERLAIGQVGILSVPLATGEALFTPLKEALNAVGMDLQKCIGFR